MKKILVILLLSLILVNTTGFYLLYSLDYIAIKQEVAEMMRDLSHRETLTLSFTTHNGKINTSDVSLTDDNELIYRGRMYDVISSSANNGQIVFKCFSDCRETELNENLSKKIDSDHEQPSQKNKNNSSSKNPTKDFTVNEYGSFCCIVCSSVPLTPGINISGLLHLSKAITHPPPEFVLS